MIGIAGGSGSGKTTVADTLLTAAGSSAASLPHDAYYRDRSDLPFHERERINYDEPNAFDTDMLVGHLDDLLAGRAVERPVYDFAVHARATRAERVEPRPVIVVEGILVLHDARLRERMTLKVFVDAPADERFIRRMLRDVQDRGRSLDGVVSQYRETVRPMFDRFVGPTKRYADLVVMEGGHNAPALDVLVRYVASLAPAQPA